MGAITENVGYFLPTKYDWGETFCYLVYSAKPQTEG